MAEKIINTQTSSNSYTASASQDQDIQMLARIAGLEGALAKFPEDVVTAARTALNIRAAFQAPIDNTAELWPVMQVKS
jgi:hypothetical protein